MYTDGGCKGNPGVGGFAAVICDENNIPIKEFAGRKQSTTNNEMELFSIFIAIKALSTIAESGSHILIHSDSQYAINCITKWAPEWKRTGTFNDHANNELIGSILKLLKLSKLRPFHYTISFNWVKGHAGIPGNEYVDMLLNKAITDPGNLSNDVVFIEL